MVGYKQSKTKLNRTLIFITNLFHKNGMKRWFIAYGTLLGIVRGKSCIDGDDDIDIICSKKYYGKIKKLLIDNGISIENGYGINNSKNIIKTKESEKYSSIDLYMARINKSGEYLDLWENILWRNCYTKNGCLLGYRWKGVLLHIPNEYKLKLKNTYGSDWMIPKDTKEWSGLGTL